MQRRGKRSPPASVAGLPRRRMWRDKVVIPRHVDRRGQKSISANNISEMLFLKYILK
jgi:hypothetical protein